MSRSSRRRSKEESKQWGSGKCRATARQELEGRRNWEMVDDEDEEGGGHGKAGRNTEDTRKTLARATEGPERSAQST